MALEVCRYRSGINRLLLSSITIFYLTGMDYMPAGGGNGKILEGRIEISQDGENWTELGTLNWSIRNP